MNVSKVDENLWITIIRRLHPLHWSIVACVAKSFLRYLKKAKRLIYYSAIGDVEVIQTALPEGANIYNDCKSVVINCGVGSVSTCGYKSAEWQTAVEGGCVSD